MAGYQCNVKVRAAMKKTLVPLLVLVFGLALVACGQGNNSNTSSNDSNSSSSDSSAIAQEEPEQTDLGDGYEKFTQLQIGMTESEVIAILGEPISVDYENYKFNVVVNGSDLVLTLWINEKTGLVTDISGDFGDREYRDAFANSSTDLSGAKGLESGEINTYDDCVRAFKTPGYLTSINVYDQTRYLWVNSDGGYLTVRFDEDGNVKSYIGIF